MKNVKIFSSLLSITVLISCGKAYFFQDNITLNNSWNQKDLLMFKVNIKDTLSPYQMFVDIRHDQNYPYQNFWTFVTTQTPDNKYYVDTISLFFSNSEGKWLGKSASGSLISHHILFKKDFLFKDTGTYTFSFEQAMRDSIIPISDFGLSIDKGKLSL